MEYKNKIISSDFQRRSNEQIILICIHNKKKMLRMFTVIYLSLVLLQFSGVYGVKYKIQPLRDVMFCQGCPIYEPVRLKLKGVNGCVNECSPRRHCYFFAYHNTTRICKSHTSIYIYFNQLITRHNVGQLVLQNFQFFL